MTGCSPLEVENPFQAYRLLLAQLRKAFLLECVELARGSFVDVRRALPRDQEARRLGLERGRAS